MNIYYRNTRLLFLTLTLIVVGGLSAWQLLPRREDPELTGRDAIVFTAGRKVRTSERQTGTQKWIFGVG